MTNQSLFKEYKDVFEEETESPKEKKERVFEYSPFALQDAIGERNVKKIWIEYQKLRLQGIVAEDIIHKMVSKVRDMSAISQGASMEDLEIKKDYPYNKSKRDLKNWKKEELKDFYEKLIDIYHSSRILSVDLDTGIEKIILSL